MLSTNSFDALGSSQLLEVLSGEIIMLLLLNIRHLSKGLCDDLFKVHLDEILEVLDCISIDSGNSSNNYSYAKWARGNAKVSTTALESANDWDGFLKWVLNEFQSNVYPVVKFNREMRFVSGAVQDKKDWGTASLTNQLAAYELDTSSYSVISDANYQNFNDSTSSSYSRFNTPRKL